MWMWPSMSPGTTVRPRRSMTRVFGVRAGAELPALAIRPLRIATALTTVLRASSV